MDYALQRKTHFCILFLGIARPQSQFPFMCLWAIYIHSQDRSTYCLQQNYWQIDRGNIEIAHRNMNVEIGTVVSGHAIPFLGIFVSNFSVLVHSSIAVCAAYTLSSPLKKGSRPFSTVYQSPPPPFRIWENFRLVFACRLKPEIMGAGSAFCYNICM